MHLALGLNIEIMDTAILKRTTYTVKDAKASAEFYEKVFGWTIWYDNILEADHRFPPTGAADKAKVHLVIMQALDPKLGKLGLLQYLDPPFEINEIGRKTVVKLGDPILVIESKDIDGVYKRALECGAHVITKPVDWYVPGPKSETTIHLRTVSLFDPNGIYMEVSDHPSRKE